MGNYKLADEIFDCIKNGWKMFNRENGKLAYFTKTTPDGKTHKLIENGHRFLIDEGGNTILSRNPQGIVTRFDNKLCREFTWTKNSNTGKYGWYNKSLDLFLFLSFTNYPH